MKEQISRETLRGGRFLSLAFIGILLFATGPAPLTPLERPAKDALYFEPSRSPMSSPIQTQSSGTAYYVDASFGNDLNSGLTPSAPWKTIHKVNTSAFSPGDSILFKRGETWREQLTVPTSGSPGAAITYASYGIGEQPIISGAAVAANWTLESGVIWKKTFAVTPSICIDNGVHPTNLHWDTDAAATFAYASAGSYAIDTANKTVYVWCVADADPNTHTMEVSASADEVCVSIPQSHVTIDGITCRNATKSGFKVLPAAGDDVTGITIQNCTITLCGSNGIRIYNENNPGSTHTLTAVHTINNTVSYCRTDGIVYEGNTHDCTASGNTVSYCGWMKDADDWGSIGIYAGGYDATEHPDNILFEHNTVHHQYRNAYATRGSEGAQMQFLDYCTNCIMRFNTLYAGQGHGITDRGTTGDAIYNNLIFKNGTETDGGAYISSSVNTHFYKNILYNNSGYGLKTSGGATMSGVLIKNNTFLDNGRNECYFYGTTNTHITSDYNCICHSSGGAFMMLDTISYNWTDWKANSGQDAYSYNSRTYPHLVFHL